MRWLPLLLAVGCGGPKDSGPAGPPSFAEVRDDVLLRSCGLASCHGAGTNGLVMDPDAPDEVYGHLVNATADSGRTLVVPGDPDGSYLVQKILADDGIEGDPMPPPFGLEVGDPDAAAQVIAWIEAGAKDD